MLQRDFEADGGLTSVDETQIVGLRQRAVEALAAVFRDLGLGAPTQSMLESVVAAWSG